MRDDEASVTENQNTIVVKIGGEKAKKYHYFF
jgi:hypothetical protein